MIILTIITKAHAMTMYRTEAMMNSKKQTIEDNPENTWLLLKGFEMKTKVRGAHNPFTFSTVHKNCIHVGAKPSSIIFSWPQIDVCRPTHTHRLYNRRKGTTQNKSGKRFYFGDLRLI